MLNTEPERSIAAENTTKVVHVCVAVIERFNTQTKATEVLIAKRPDHVHQGGLWEFPGGKVERGESLVEALDRELYEELDIKIKPFFSINGASDLIRPLIQIQHAYSDKTVLLDTWRIQVFSGDAIGKEGQDVRWVETSSLHQYAFPEANHAILKACLLPSRYFITPVYTSILDAEIGLKRALNDNAKLIYFRQPQLANKEYIFWLKQLISRYPELESKLLLQNVDALDMISAAGVHLSYARSAEYNERPIGKNKWFAISCHDDLEIDHSTRLDADFITLSPVLKTKTHPEQAEMGWDKFKGLVSVSKVPVFGLGGLSEEHEQQLRQSGAQGLAGIGFWQF